METPPGGAGTAREISGFLNRLEARLAEVDHSLFLAWWSQYAGLSHSGTARWDTFRSRLVGRPELLNFLRTAQARPQPPLLLRRLQLVQRIAEDALVEQHPSVVRRRATLVRRVFTFRPRWDGRRVPEARVRRLLRTNRDRAARRRAFLALQELANQLEGDFPGLVEARNARARALGYASFMDFRLRAEGLTLPQLEGFIRRIQEASRIAHRRFREQFLERTGSSGFLPWDLSFAENGRNPLPESAFPGPSMAADALRTIRAWGFRGPRRPFQIVQRSIPVGGFTLAVKIPRDVRVAVNPKGGWHHYEILLHEFGHAVQDWYTVGRTHVLQGPENIPGYAGFHEGIGGLFELVAADERWLRARQGASPELVREFLANTSDEELWMAGWTANWVWKEVQMYKRPRASHREEFHRASRGLFGFDDFPVQPSLDPFWIEAAFYSKSYLLAAILRAQLRRAIEEQLPGPFWPNRQVIPWLRRHWFRYGARFDWVPRVREVTGRALDVTDLLRAR